MGNATLLVETYKGFKIGDRVHVKVTENSYKYGKITPDMPGTIKSFPPKVRIIKRPPLMDGLPYFAYVEFDKIADEEHQNHFRGGIDICNLSTVQVSGKKGRVGHPRLL